MIIPFNHRPSAVQVVTGGTYTVPANTYARIIGASYDVEIDSVKIAHLIGNGSTSSTGDILNRIGSDCPIMLNLSKSSASSVTVLIKDGAGTTLSTHTFSTGGVSCLLPAAFGYTVNVSANGSGNGVSASAYSTRHVGAELWVKAGQVITAGENFLVEEYSDYS